MACSCSNGSAASTLQAVLRRDYDISDSAVDDRYIESLKMWKFWTRVMAVRTSQSQVEHAALLCLPSSSTLSRGDGGGDGIWV